MAVALLKENSQDQSNVVFFNNEEEARAMYEYHKTQMEYYEKIIKEIEKSKKPEPKLRKDGGEKQTPNNQCFSRTQDPLIYVDPFTGEQHWENVQCVLEYLDNKISTAKTRAKLRTYMKDAVIFVCGINMGYRISDLLHIKWNHLYKDKELTKMYDYNSIREDKTGNIREFYTNDSMKKICDAYIKEFGDEVKPDHYVISKYGDKPFSDEKVNKLIKECVNACDIKGKYSTHSLRKTAGSGVKMYSDAHGGNGVASAQAFYGHGTSGVTLRYIGENRRRSAMIMQKVNLGGDFTWSFEKRR